ncbi:MAG: hypothetical protein RL721_1875, partial [Candidatus Eisenbacteria bacterium]
RAAEVAALRSQAEQVERDLEAALARWVELEERAGG